MTVEKVDNIKMEKKQTVQNKTQKFNKFCYIALPILLLSVILVGSGTALVHTYTAKYHNYLSVAQVGIQHLRTGASLLEALPKDPFNAPAVNQAQHEFASASTDFVQLDNDLKSLPGISTYVPVYGARLSTALRLVPLAIEVSQAGLVGCNVISLLVSSFHNPLNGQGHGLSMADLTVLGKDFQEVKATFDLAIGQVNSLQPADLQVDPRISKLVVTFHKEIPMLQTWLEAVEKLLPVAPALLGISTPSNYLIEVLDSTELRPGGGFIGNYGIATISGGRLTTAHITDTYLLDQPFNAAGHSIPFPAAYTWFDLASSWSLRDSNLDADFPTAARYAELNFAREGGRIPVQGVIAITPAFIENALGITGPIPVPEYHETVTAQNLVDRIHYYQVGAGERANGENPSPDGISSVRKRFTALLAEHFLTRLQQLPPSSLPKLMQLLISSLPSKDIQVYFNPGTAEDLLRNYHLDATIQSPSGDSLFIVDANFSPNKANSLINSTLDDQVTIDDKGNAVHHTTIRYAWVRSGSVYGSSLYRDYARVYVPPASLLQTQDGWQPRGSSKAFGREVWAGYFTLSYGQTQTITLVWSVPGAARKDAHGWHYQYLMQRQAGTSWRVNLRVILPACAVINNSWGGLVSLNRQTATLTQSLNKDMNLGVDYACQ